MVCKNCGKELTNGASICGSCGTVVEPSNEKIEVNYPDEVEVVDAPVITESHTFVDDGDFLEKVNVSQKEKKKKSRKKDGNSEDVVGTWEEEPPKKSFAIWIFMFFLLIVIGLVFYFVIWPNVFVNKEDNKPPVSDRENSSFSSNLWTADEFMIDGVLYKLNGSFSSLEESGWSINVEQLGEEGKLSVQKGEKLSNNITLTSDTYPNGNLQVGIVNLGDIERDVRECEIWSIMIDNQNATSPISFMLPGGIQNGSSVAEVIAAYGELEESQIQREEELGYTIYHYSYDYSQYLDLTIYDNGGLLQFNYRHY